MGLHLNLSKGALVPRKIVRFIESHFYQENKHSKERIYSNKYAEKAIVYIS